MRAWTLTVTQSGGHCVHLDFRTPEAATNAAIALHHAINLEEASISPPEDDASEQPAPGRNPPFEDEHITGVMASACRCGWTSAGSPEHQRQYGLRWHAESHGCKQAQAMMREAEANGRA